MDKHTETAHNAVKSDLASNLRSAPLQEYGY